MTPATLSGSFMLRGLPSHEQAQLFTAIEMVNLAANAQLTTDAYIYFPTTSRISLRGIAAETEHREIATVFPGESTGYSEVLAAAGLRTYAWSVAEGASYRLEHGEFSKMHTPMLVQRMESLDKLMLGRVLRTMCCSNDHNLSQRVSRYILAQGAQEMSVTQQMIADSLGCRREGVTEVMADLEAAGVILHTRGRVRITSREQLSKWSCGCEKHLLPF